MPLRLRLCKQVSHKKSKKFGNPKSVNKICLNYSDCSEEAAMRSSSQDFVSSESTASDMFQLCAG